MNKKQTIAAIRALPGMTATCEEGEYRVTLRNVDAARAERVACYTDDADDALATARAMSEHEAGRRGKLYATAKAARATLEDELQRIAAELEAIPGVGTGPMGLTPDAIKARPDYKQARARYQSMFAALRQFNQGFCKEYAAELRADRDARRAALVEGWTA